MVEQILEKIINEMSPHLEQGQLEHLSNVLFVNFHGKKLQEQCTELTAAGVDGDELKILMFIASKKAVNRQDETLKQYAREIYNMLDFLGKRIEDITGMDLRYYYGVMRERRGIKMSTMQTRLHYLSSFWDFLITEDLVHSNPVKKVGVLKLEKTIKKPYSAEELEALRVNCTGLRDRALVEFLYSTGVRVSELVALNVRDIEMGKQSLIVYGKGSKERKTYLTDGAKFYLRRYLQTRQQDGQESHYYPMLCHLEEYQEQHGQQSKDTAPVLYPERHGDANLFLEDKKASGISGSRLKPDKKEERETGLEPATPTLARSYSTN